MPSATAHRLLRRAAATAALGAFTAGPSLLTPLVPAGPAAAASGTFRTAAPSRRATTTRTPREKVADEWGFAVAHPQTSTADNSLSCFSWSDSTKDTPGNGEAAPVEQMVDTAVTSYGSDRGRVFVTGLTAGGAVDSGPAAPCATTRSAASARQYGNQNLTPGVTPVNGTELRDQWTAVRGVGQTASGTESLPGGTTESIYDPASGADRCGPTGAYYLNSLCSSPYTAKLTTTTVPRCPGPPSTVPPRTTSTVTEPRPVRRRTLRTPTPVCRLGTSYRYTVAAVDSTGVVGSSPMSLSPTRQPETSPGCFVIADTDC
ncbi:PHB depolymerase family esterase [Streptomyces lasalocidi]